MIVYEYIIRRYAQAMVIMNYSFIRNMSYGECKGELGALIVVSSSLYLLTVTHNNEILDLSV